jgi:hypothetical protein
MTEAEMLKYLLSENSQLHAMFGGTPTLRDLCFTVFMHAKNAKNADDGGPVDWFNDTAPLVDAAIENIRAKIAQPVT